MDDKIAQAQVERTASDGWRLRWDDTLLRGSVQIRAAASPDALDQAAVVAAQASSGIELQMPGDAGRLYFLLQSATGEQLIVAERALPFSGAVNFRDLGGYASERGGRVRWGKLFRSGHLSNLSAADRELFAQLAVSQVCDFRTETELAAENASLPGSPEVAVLGIIPGVGDAQFFHRLFASRPGHDQLLDAMHQMLSHLVRDAAPCYQRLFEVLLNNQRGAVLMNCSAGKERTGVASALVLSALGVPRDTIMYDFMLSERYFPAEAEVPRVLKKYRVEVAGEAGRALIMPLLETRPSYLEAAFSAIDEDFGSTEQFLRVNYALGPRELARLRELYTG